MARETTTTTTTKTQNDFLAHASAAPAADAVDPTMKPREREATPGYGIVKLDGQGEGNSRGAIFLSEP